MAKAGDTFTASKNGRCLFVDHDLVGEIRMPVQLDRPAHDLAQGRLDHQRALVRLACCLDQLRQRGLEGLGAVAKKVNQSGLLLASRSVEFDVGMVLAFDEHALEEW